MVRVFSKNKIKADVIVLGCSLPGIVTAHKLKKKFGNTMDIVVLDLAHPPGLSRARQSKGNVVFQEDPDEPFGDEDDEVDSEEVEEEQEEEQETSCELVDNVARYFLHKYAKEFHVPIPVAIMSPITIKSPLAKLFQNINGDTRSCMTDFHDFDYLSFIEKFELNQYQMLLDLNMKELFQRDLVITDTKSDRNRLLYYDRTTMEEHICGALLFRTSREIMRTTVRLVCGAAPKTVSVLFYLHQCFRTSGGRNHLGGDNTRFREKLLGFCRKRLAHQLQRSVADITVRANSIKRIRASCADEKVILESMKGETTYVCNLLAMALKPDELIGIRFDKELFGPEQVNMTKEMTPGRARKFVIQYEENVWSQQGYSGDILSIRGPIVWAMEKPKLSTTGSVDRYFTLIGYLKVLDDSKHDSKEDVIEQLVKLFGNGAATPATYTETVMEDVYVPRCGDYVALRLLKHGSPKFLEWGALDIFADGDVVASLEAGHSAYIHLLSCLRPQAQTFEEMASSHWPTFLASCPVPGWIARVNYVSGFKLTMFAVATIVAFKLLLSYARK